jgi:hypothetical protein
MNADFNKDMNNIVDRKIAEIFKSYSANFEIQDDQEDSLIKNDIKIMNNKIDTLTDLVSKLIATNSTGIRGDQQQPSTTSPKKPKTKKEEAVFIPKLETNDITINSKTTNKTLYDNNMIDSLSALNKLK